MNKIFKKYSNIYNEKIFTYDESLNIYSTNIKKLENNKNIYDWKPPFYIVSSPIYIKTKHELLAFEFEISNKEFIVWKNYN